MRETEGEFVFFFVDPIGVREIPWTAVSRLIARPRSELLINLNSVVAARLAGITLGRSAHAPAARQRLTAVMGHGQWEQGLPEARQRGEMRIHLAAAYANGVRQVGGYSVSWSSIAERGDQGRPKYHLVFASRVMKAFLVMNDILHIQRERLRRERALANPLPLFALTEDEYDVEREEELVSQLASALAADADLREKTMRVEDIYPRVVSKHFASFKEALYARAATRLESEGRLSVVGDRKTYRGFLQRSVTVHFP